MSDSSGPIRTGFLNTFLLHDIFPCTVCVQTITGHLTVNTTIQNYNCCVKDVCKSICNTRVCIYSLDYQKRKETGDQNGSKYMNPMPSC